MKKPLEVKCDNKILGKVQKIEQTEEGIEITFIPTNEFYKLKQIVNETITKVKAREINKELI